MHDLIFVSIASYRDPQLEPTVRDCLCKAHHPARLRFGICLQREESDPPVTLPAGLAERGFEDPRFRVLSVDWRDSKGVCWARGQIMSLWQGENWYLQIDSHCRFAQGWDSSLIRMIEETGSSQPILSTYANPFTPGDHESLEGHPLQIAFQAFTPEGIPQLKPAPFPGGRSSLRPLRARFVAAGFLFVEGRFVEKVPYDPELYFMGEEAAMTVRAFTHGYDLFHPGEVVIWHDYLRADARKHWGDHTGNTPARPDWIELDEAGRAKVARLLSGADMSQFGLGRVRSLAEYEAYAGLSFSLKKAQLYTVRAQEPPNPECPPDWPEKIYPWIVRARFNRAQLPPGSLEDPSLWSLSIQDGEGFEICRRDLSPQELEPLSGTEFELALICEFQSETIPARWSVWPLSRSRGWIPKLEGVLGEDDFAILKEEDF